MKERWKQHHTGYWISTLGRVISWVNYKKGKRFIKPRLGTPGYLRFSIKRNKELDVHRAVIETFRGPIPPKMQVNHINGIKTDNRLLNLEVVTRSDNMRHAYKTGLLKPYKRK